LISALADLAWPVVAVFFVYQFKPEITGLLRRLKKGTLFGQEFDFEDLQRSAEAAEALPEQPVEGGSRLQVTAEVERATPAEPELAEATQRILEEAASSPKLALMGLSAELERESREILASSQAPDSWQGRSLRQKLARIELPRELRGAIEEFRAVRNRIVHGHDTGEDDALRALDYGLRILRALNRVPRASHFVREPQVEVFADAAGEQLRSDVHGVMIDSFSGGSGEPQTQVFPTTRTHFEKGQAVAWEWDTKRSWNESWYRDPETGEIEYAWTGALEFVGRPLHEL